MTDDVKDLLARAFTQEPPLRIDRDEVLQQGRKRLRRKRVFEASSVVAAVLVAAVGAATLTNLADDEAPHRMPPAASTTASPGPSSQPMTPSTTPPGTSTTTTHSPNPPSVETSKAESQQAAELTTSLLKSGFLTPFIPQSVEGPVGEPGFTVKADTYYEYEADLYSREPGASGYLRITIDYAPGRVVDCGVIPEPYLECEIRGPVATARLKSPTGEFRNYAVTVLDDGTRVSVITSNMTTAERVGGHPAASPQPPFDKGTLRALVTIPDFSVH